MIGGPLAKRLALGLTVALAALAAPQPGQAQQAVTSSSSAFLRALDKLTGETTDIDISRGEVKEYGRLSIRLGDCRYPPDSPNSEAYALLEIRDSRVTDPVFRGWMIASSPALSALDHPRYDVWVLRCNIS